MNHTALTTMILELNSMLDTGQYDDIDIHEVKARIEDGTILEFLRDRGGQDIDLSLHDEDFETFYVPRLQSILGGYAGNERRKWGVENRGLCLLIAWTNEIIQRGSGWEAASI